MELETEVGREHREATGTYVQVQMGCGIRDWYMELETETMV